MKNNYSLIMLRANIRERKGKRVFILTETNFFPGTSLEEGLYLMKRCGLPLWAGEGLNQASFIYKEKEVACYKKDSGEIVLAILYKKEDTSSANCCDSDISIYPEIPESFHLPYLTGVKFNRFVEDIIKKVDAGKRLGEDFVEKVIRKARLSLVPEGWEVVQEGNVKTGDRYLEEDRTRGYITIVPAIISWLSCDVSFSAHKPGSPVKKYGWDDDIIIRKKTKLSAK